MRCILTVLCGHDTGSIPPPDSSASVVRSSESMLPHWAKILSAAAAVLHDTAKVLHAFEKPLKPLNFSGMRTTGIGLPA